MLNQGWKSSVLKSDVHDTAAGEMASVQFQVTVPENAPFTRPYWSRNNPETETVYTISNSGFLTNPWPPYSVHAHVKFKVGNNFGEASALAKIKFVDPTLGQSERPLIVGPPISVLLTSPVVVAPVGGTGKSQIGVSVRSNVQSAVHAKLKLETPQGWQVEPAEIAVDLDHDGDVNNYAFQITPQNLHEGTYKVTARAEYNGKQYAEGFKVITRPDLDSYYAVSSGNRKRAGRGREAARATQGRLHHGHRRRNSFCAAKRRAEHQHHHAAGAGFGRSQPLRNNHRRHSRL